MRLPYSVRRSLHLKFAMVALFAAAAVTVAPQPGVATCFHPSGTSMGAMIGDLNGSNTINVADAMCTVLTSLWTAGGQMGDAPGCLGSNSHLVADTNCDGTVTTSDVQLIVGLSLGQTFPGVVDDDGDGCPSQCISCGGGAALECFADAQCHADGASNPGNGCQVCDAATSLDSWSGVVDGAVCGSAGLCLGGSCAEIVTGTPSGLFEGDLFDFAGVLSCPVGYDCSVTYSTPGVSETTTAGPDGTAHTSIPLTEGSGAFSVNLTPSGGGTTLSVAGPAFTVESGLPDFFDETDACSQTRPRPDSKVYARWATTRTFVSPDTIIDAVVPAGTPFLLTFSGYSVVPDVFEVYLDGQLASEITIGNTPNEYFTYCFDAEPADVQVQVVKATDSGGYAALWSACPAAETCFNIEVDPLPGLYDGDLATFTNLFSCPTGYDCAVTFATPGVSGTTTSGGQGTAHLSTALSAGDGTFSIVATPTAGGASSSFPGPTYTVIPADAPAPSLQPVAFACSSVHDVHVCARAFDGDTTPGNHWHSAYHKYDAAGDANDPGGEWARADYGDGNAAILSAVRLMNASNNGHARDIIVEGSSSDSGPWQQVGSRVEAVPDQGWQTVSVDDSSAFRYFRVRVPRNHYNGPFDAQNHSWIKFTEIEFVASAGDPPPTVEPIAFACSSEHQTHACARAFDGITSSSNHWHAAYFRYDASGEPTTTDGEWARADYGSGNEQTVVQVRLLNASNNGHAKDVVVETSNSASGPWTAVGSATNLPASKAWQTLDLSTQSAHRFYRVRVTANHYNGPFDAQNHSWIKFTEIELIVGDPAPVAVADDYACSSEHGGNECIRAFDGTTANHWHSAYSRFDSNGNPTTTDGEWARVDYGAGNDQLVTAVNFINTSNNGHARDVRVEGAPTASGPWTELGSVANVPADKEWHTVSLTNSTAYRFYRIRVVRNHYNGPFDAQNHSWVKFSEVEFIAGSPPASDLPIGSACSSEHQSHTCNKAFDGQTTFGNQWHSAYFSYDSSGNPTVSGGEWARAEFSGAKTFDVVRFINLTNNGHARDVVIEGASSAGGPWTALGSATDIGPDKEWKSVTLTSPGAYTFYRVRITRNYYNGPFDAQNHSWVKLSEVQFLAAASAPQPPSGPPSASNCSSVHAGNGCDRAFDGNNGSHWHAAYNSYSNSTGNPSSGTGQWLLADYGAGNAVVATSITFLNSSNNGHARDVVFEASDSSSGPWNTLASQSNIGEKKTNHTMNFSNSTGYRYYRLRVTRIYAPGSFDGNNTHWLKISELDIL